MDFLTKLMGLGVDEEEERLIVSRFNDIEWVDDVSEYQCSRCSRVLVQHYIANCEHKFCSNCKITVGYGSMKWKCPKCQQYIMEIDKQDFKFRERVFELRVHCPNQKYGCPDIFKLKELKEHLKTCQHTLESTSKRHRLESGEPNVIVKSKMKKEIKGVKTMMSEATVVDEMTDWKMEWMRESTLTKIMANERLMERMIERRMDKIMENSIIKLRIEMFMKTFLEKTMEDSTMKRKMEIKIEEMMENERLVKRILENDKFVERVIGKGIEERLGDREMKLKEEVNRLIDVMKLDLKFERAKISIDMLDMKKSVEESQSKIIKLEENDQFWMDIVEKKNRNVENVLQELKVEIQQQLEDRNKLEELIEVIQTEIKEYKAEAEQKEEYIIKNNEIELKKLVEEIKEEIQLSRKELNLKLKTEISEVKESVNKDILGLNDNWSKFEVKFKEEKNLEKETKNNFNQKIYFLENYLFQIPQMSIFDLVEENHINFHPSLTWNISELKTKLNHQKAIEVTSDAFSWTGYPVQARAKVLVTETGLMSASLNLQVPNNVNLKLIPNIFYVLKEQNKNRKCVTKSSSLGTRFSSSLDFRSELVHNSWFTFLDNFYVTSGFIELEVHVEPPAMTQQVYSYNGTLSWVIDSYRKRKEMERDKTIKYYESPCFYTSARGYRVRIKMRLSGEKGLMAKVCFLTGEFDEDLPLTFHHGTSITLINRGRPEDHVIKKVENDIKQGKSYWIEMGSDKDIEKVIKNDTIFYSVTVKEID